MLHSNITEENINLLINKFYQKVYQDKDLGPIFKKAIGERWEEWGPHLEILCGFWSSVMLVFKKAIGERWEEWGPHLEILCGFWSSVMLGTKSYHGNPMAKHLALPSFNLNLFERWLALFAETADELFIDNIALEFKAKSQRIAESLKLMLLYKANQEIV